jgi:hypothetical protein
MGKGHLIDTNIVIANFGNMIPEKGASFIKNLPLFMSVITRIELLGWHNAPRDELMKLENFVANATFFELSERIILKTIEIRQRYRIKTPDAIIAATALVHGFTLITRNTADFEKIDGLDMLNPFDL